MGIVTGKVMRTSSRQQQRKQVKVKANPFSRRGAGRAAWTAALLFKNGQLGTEKGDGGREAVVILHY